jgi:hypothetical protein
MNHFDFCYGAGINWVDMNTGRMYHIQEYKERKDKGEDVDKIRVTRWDIPDSELDPVSEMKLREIMEDPEPDPRY